MVPQPTPTGEPVGNAAPFVDAVVGSDSAVVPGAELALRALAHDPNAGEALTYAWRATGGSFSDAAAQAPVWTAPGEAGDYSLTLQVTDARGAAATLDFGVQVQRGGTGGEARAVFNRWPSLAELVGPTEDVGVGSPVALQAAGVDEDGDALDYAWRASCEGAFDDAAAAQASFTPSAEPEAACDNCRLTLTV
ncbi:PKD domain-containing protein, partial [Pyxidicoccus sp. 3LG]